MYPAIAVAEAMKTLQPGAKVHFICSNRSIDAKILSEGGYEFTALPARAFSARPDRFLAFAAMYFRSMRVVKSMLAEHRPAVLLGIGGYVSAPAVTAAGKLGVPVAVLNVDMVPGKANKVMAREAAKVFVQWEETRKYLGEIPGQVVVSGCPLRGGFGGAAKETTLKELGLDAGKKALLVMGGSSGALTVNRAVCACLPTLDAFAESWQIVHVTGPGIAEVRKAYEAARIGHKVIEYYHEMPALMSCADLAVGRAGAVSVAEYAAAGLPAIMLPYPYHKDQHQKLNARQLVRAGGGLIVEDKPDAPEATAGELAEHLKSIMADGTRLAGMSVAAKSVDRPDAAAAIAQELAKMPG